MLVAERIIQPVTHHGEGPFWDTSRNRLLCLDVMEGEIVAIERDGQSSRFELPCRVATVIRRRACGGFAIGTGTGLAVSDESFNNLEQIVEICKDPTFRTNDGGCDPFGGFVVGTMAYDERHGGGVVYRITPDYRVTKLLAPVSISNGVQWSADRTRAYYIDTPTRSVQSFDIDPSSGGWDGRRTHIRLDDPSGLPDGMAIDEEDGLWIAMWGGGAVAHYDAEGRFVETVRVPSVSQVSACAFGSDDLQTLFITTSRLGLADGDEPNAGAVFAVQTRTRGAVQWQFAG